jgi:predicted dehydrogenase
MNSWASVPVPGVDRTEGSRWRAPRFEIDGTKGTLTLTADASMHLVTDTDRKRWQFHQDVQSESCANTQRHFIDCLESSAEFETSGSETLKTMALVYACYRSAEEGGVVRQAEFLK